MLFLDALPRVAGVAGAFSWKAVVWQYSPRGHGCGLQGDAWQAAMCSAFNPMSAEPIISTASFIIITSLFHFIWLSTVPWKQEKMASRED